MFTTVRFMVLVILVLIIVLSAWSKLRFLDEGSDQPQRWRVEDYSRQPATPSRTH